jgi:hypothetical protein
MAQFNNTKIIRYLNMAKEASKQSNFKQHHLGAVVIYKGSLLAIGHNSTKTNPRQKELNRERGWDVEASDAHNTAQEKRSGGFLRAAPLPIPQLRLQLSPVNPSLGQGMDK